MSTWKRESGRWLKQGETEGMKMKSNGGGHSKGRNKSKQGKQVCFGDEQQLGKTGAENAGEPEVLRKTTVGTDRQRKILASSEGEMRGVRRTRPAGKAKGRATEERVNMKAKGGGFGQEREHSWSRDLVMDEIQENHREDVRKLVA